MFRTLAGTVASGKSQKPALDDALRTTRRSLKSSSGYRGVHVYGKGWAACIRKDKREMRVGVFDTAEKAARAHDAAARLAFGSHALLNFPETGEQNAQTKEVEDPTFNKLLAGTPIPKEEFEAYLVRMSTEPPPPPPETPVLFPQGPCTTCGRNARELVDGNLRCGYHTGRFRPPGTSARAQARAAANAAATAALASAPCNHGFDPTKCPVCDAATSDALGTYIRGGPRETPAGWIDLGLPGGGAQAGGAPAQWVDLGPPGGAPAPTPSSGAAPTRAQARAATRAGIAARFTLPGEAPTPALGDAAPPPVPAPGTNGVAFVWSQDTSKTS